MRRPEVASIIALLACSAEAGWVSAGPDGGRLQALAVAPADPAVLYAVSYEDTVSPRCYRSADHGLSWTLAGRLCDSLVTSLAVDPLDPGLVHACGRDTCIMRSTNSGSTWERVGVEGFAAALAPDPARTGRVYACGYFRDTVMHPVFFVSTDYGASWQRSLIDTVAGHGMCLRAGGDIYAGGTCGLLWRSTDSGATWERRDAGLPPTATVLSVSAAGAAVLAGTSAGLFRSADSGRDWRLVAPETKSWKAGFSADASVAYAIGYDFFARFYVSADSGVTWVEASPGTWVGRADGLVPDPGSADVAYLCGNAGVKRSGDRGQNWALRNMGMRFATATGLRSAGHDRSHVYMAARDNGLFRSLSGGEAWERCADFTVCGHVADVCAVRGPAADIVYAMEGAG